ncbi:MAG: hypothetical protein EP311_01875 [Cytophagales bacterium]|nr:MAG: hypothetical protein EP311_01875 [Cytophagales bacterium]
MKILLVVLALLIASPLLAQDGGFGPKMKNAKIGKITSPRIALVHEGDISSAKGPKAKNTEVWNKESRKRLNVGFRKEINNPKALQAKNSNPWDKEKPEVNSKAVYEEPKSMRSKKRWIH